jgi:hypothetical protein
MWNTALWVAQGLVAALMGFTGIPIDHRTRAGRERRAVPR